MSGVKYIQMKDADSRRATEELRRQIEEREQARREAMRRAAEEEMCRRLTAAREDAGKAHERLNSLIRLAEQQGLPSVQVIHAEGTFDPLPADADVQSWREREAALVRASGLLAVCTAVAAELPDASSRALLAGQLAKASTPKEVRTCAETWREGAGLAHAVVRANKEASTAAELLRNLKASGLRLTAEQEEIAAWLEKFINSPRPQDYDDAVRTLARLDVPHLQQRLHNRREHILRRSETLCNEWAQVLSEWRPGLPEDLSKLTRDLKRDDWSAATEIVAEIDACFSARARLRMHEFLAKGSDQGLKPGQIIFDSQQTAYRASLSDSRGHFADVVHSASGWNVIDPDEMMVCGPSHYSGMECAMSDLGTVIKTLQAQGVQIDLLDEQHRPLLSGERSNHDRKTSVHSPSIKPTTQGQKLDA